MKTIITCLGIVTSLAVSAQTVSITFQGAANRGRNYQVVIDGVSYYSANAVATSGRQVTTINNLSEGAHNLEVYTTGNNSGYSDGSTAESGASPIYTKTFQLRQGYDMNIAVRGNGQVSFTEKRSDRTGTAYTGSPMNTTTFNQLVQSIKSRRYQSDKITGVRNAFTASANYFNTSQVRQLVSMVAAESRRLELAKLAYSKVTDKDNFSTVYDVLQSESSRDDLDNYVVAQGGSTMQNTTTYPAYGTAMSSAKYTQLLNRAKGYSYQADRVTTIRSAFEDSYNYFSTTQVRQLLTLLNAESDRLTLAKQAYGRVVDQTAYNQLADLFYIQANRTEFADFIRSNGGTVNSNTAYTAATAMSDAAFQQLYNKAGSHFFQKNTVTEVQTALGNTANKFSTEQVRTLLQLVSMESTRLSLAKTGYDRVVDPLNYSRVVDLFTTESYRTDLENYIRSKQ